MAKKRSSARLDREIVQVLGKKGKRWASEVEKQRSRPLTPKKPAATVTPTPKEMTAKEKSCRYCRQALYWAPDGHFECGGKGEGACSFWSAIGDYDRAGRPADIEGWLDDWIQRELGTDWDTIGWDRAAHAKAIRDYFKLSEK